MLQRILGYFGWPFTVFLFMVPIIMWINMMPINERFNTSYQALTSIGRLSGIVAVTLFCLNVVLTTRLKFLELLFGGLNKMYIAHHLIGGLALCVVLIHPIALSLRQINISLHEAAIFLVPRLSDIPTAIGIIALWLFIALMMLTFYINLPYKIWLFTHKFLGLVLLLIGLHVVLVSGDTSSNRALKIYLLALLSLAIVSFIYRTLLPRFFVRRYIYTISQVTQPAQGVVKITMVPKNQPIRFRAGQFIFASFRSEGFSREWHPFSISSNNRDGNLSITVKSLGSYTNTLVKLAPGMVGMDVGVEGAYGRFSFRNFKSKRQIWVAGGIGVTPYLGMLKDVTPDYKIDFYYSVKSESEMIDIDEIEQIAVNSQGGIRFIPVVTERDGFLTADAIGRISGDLSSSEILLCGPPPMMHSLRDQLKTQNIKRWKVHSEEFSMS